MQPGSVLLQQESTLFAVCFPLIASADATTQSLTECKPTRENQDGAAAAAAGEPGWGQERNCLASGEVEAEAAGQSALRATVRGVVVAAVIWKRQVFVVDLTWWRALRRAGDRRSWRRLV